MKATLSLCAWSDYQHYRDRDPTWIKAHRNILSSEAWLLGTDQTRLVQFASMLLAARYSNLIPYSPELIRKAANIDMSDREIERAITHLCANNFMKINAATNGELSLEHSASNLLATCSSEESRGEKRRKDIPPIPPFDPGSVEGLDQEAWSQWVAYRAQRKPAIKPISMRTAAQEMAKLGEGQMAAVRHSIANGWQGLIAPRVTAGVKALPKPKSVEQLELEEREREQRQSG